MDKNLLYQLYELSSAFSKIGLRPLICGGLGIYLSLYDRQSELEIRTTNDIDLMLTRQQVSEQAGANAIAEIITGQLEYKVCPGREHHQFEKGIHNQLDILVPPVDGNEIKDYRVKIVKSQLHGHITDEACFIEEDVRTISLSNLIPDNPSVQELFVDVPSPTNLLLLKLYAFRDRNSGSRQNDDLSRVHAFDIYTIVTLATLQDYKEGQQFLTRHSDSEIIIEAKKIVKNNFSTLDSSGWMRVLENTSFYSDMNLIQKRDKIQAAQDRLQKWFLSQPT